MSILPCTPIAIPFWAADYRKFVVSARTLLQKFSTDCLVRQCVDQQLRYYILCVDHLYTQDNAQLGEVQAG
ncbi:hypothetical protein [Endozoicomonas atrinae]|uniref:hypothetical protein n=1 Tax=Endozoicomonas atrinae TaxID=1333660 RepID=UPI003B001FAA